MTDNYIILKRKLNAFRTRYYLYEFLRGLIITVASLILLYLLFSLVEYSVYLSTNVRKVIFFGYLIFAALLIVQFAGVPLFKLLHILKPLDTKALTKIIQQHFAEIKDKLLNVIELHEINDSRYSNALLSASIDQKIEDLKPFNFKDAIQFKHLRYIFIYLIISLLFVFSVILFNKNIITDSTKRLVHYNEQFTKPAPYDFHLINKELRVKKGEAFMVELACKGKEIPQIIYINIDGNNYLMQQKSNGNFMFEVASVINSFNFYFTDLKYQSQLFTLQLIPKPGITDFTVSINPPTYTNYENKTLKNIGDLTVPSGTSVKWNFTGIDVDSLYIIYNDSTHLSAKKDKKVYSLSTRFYQSTAYKVFVKNDLTESELALTYQIEVIPDVYPEIEVENVQDSTQLTRFFFKGEINDDYGFKNLQFHYNINNKDSAVNLQIIKNISSQPFYFSFDFKDLNVESGIISYYFSVTDNDYINGYKTTTSNNFTFKFPNKEELDKSEKEQFNKLENMLIESQELTKDIQTDLKDLQLKNMDNSVSEWDKSQSVNNIIQKQNKLENLYNKIKQQNEQLNKYLESFDKPSEELIEKQKEIQKLLDEVFTDEMKKLLEEFNKLAKYFNSKKFNELSKEMDMFFQDVEKQLDRNLEMLKRMKIEQKFQDAINDINKLAEVQKKLQEALEKEKNFDAVKEQVEAQKKELERIQKNVENALEMNKELKKPMSLDSFNLEMESIKQSMQKSMEELNNKNVKKSSKQLQNSKEELENLAFSMQQMLDANTKEEASENLENLRQILSNLLYMSFEQENILTELRSINSSDPRLKELNQQQVRLINQRKIVKDSLITLSMRTPAISNMVTTELQNMELQMDMAKEQMEEAQFSRARTSQQFSLTAINNLALMLNESLDKLENQKKNASNGDCDKPGQKSGGKPKPGLGKLKEQAQSIKSQLEKMIEQMKNGKKQGRGQSQQLGQSLQQHEMMQKMIRDLMNGEGVGSGTKNVLKKIDKLLDENRKQLINKSINADMLQRQNQITTRLLEAEKAEKERDFEDKRESKSADEFYSNPVKYFENKEDSKQTIEYFQKNSHKLNNFYESKYKEYLRRMKKNSK